MSDILSERKADKEAIKSLLRYIKQLQERYTMSKILFDENGDIYRATSFQQLSQEDLERELVEAETSVKEVRESIEFSNRLQAKTEEVATPVVEAAPVVEAPAPVEPEAPVVPTVVEEAQPEVAAPIDPATAAAPAPIVLS